MYKVKLKDGVLEVYKARACIDGRKQQAGRDYYESYAPTVSPSSVRMSLAFGVEEDMTTLQQDIDAAFLSVESSQA